MEDNVYSMYFNIGAGDDISDLKDKILKAYSEHDKVRMIYDLNGKKVNMEAMLKLKNIFREVGVKNLVETCVICKDGLKKTLIKKFLGIIKTERPVKFI